MYDAIIVGARVAGAPTAMLLARQGHKVLLVDRDSFPSDMMSTHMIHTPAIAKLKKWGLLDRVEAGDCPPTRTATVDFGGLTLTANIPEVDGVDASYAIRRHVLDTMLVEAAVEAGVELRTGVTVNGLLYAGDRVIGITGTQDGQPVRETARIVIGADGMHSRIAKAVGAAEYNTKPTLSAAYYSYFSGAPVDGIELYMRPQRIIGLQATNAGNTMVFVQIPRAEFGDFKKDVEGNFWKALDLVPELAARLRRGQREERFVGTGDLPNFFRQPWGPGWALVGDAGYHKDPTLGHGIMDAFYQADLLAEAVGQGLRGEAAMEDALEQYRQTRDEHHFRDYELITSMADVAQPPPPEAQALMGALHGNQPRIDQYFAVISGVVPVQEFFAPENIGAIFQEAAQRVPIAA